MPHSVELVPYWKLHYKAQQKPHLCAHLKHGPNRTLHSTKSSFSVLNLVSTKELLFSCLGCYTVWPVWNQSSIIPPKAPDPTQYLVLTEGLIARKKPVDNRKQQTLHFCHLLEEYYSLTMCFKWFSKFSMGFWLISTLRKGFDAKFRSLMRKKLNPVGIFSCSFIFWV